MRNHKLLYQSSYDRGLEWLLKMWPDIKAKYKDATLDVAYGWTTFDALTAGNPERQEWKRAMVELLKQDGITEHGRIGKEELRKLRQECGILSYPSHFFEIFCIGVVEAQLEGCVPVTTSLGALPETVECGVLVDGDISDEYTRKDYLEALLSLMGDEKRRHELGEKGKEWAKKFDWVKIAHKWSDEFDVKDKRTKLTVYTPTIRKGFWNLMANNLSMQTYKNFEWIIVDDFPEDRSKLAKEYADKYTLDIKYVRGKPRKVQRKYGLCNANNTVLDYATGEVLVFLQDFILIPEDGLEQIAILHKKNPDCLLALPDMYFSSKVPVNKESEDWFNGETDVIGEFIRQNIRIQNLGLRFTENPMDFEQNYGAIPVKIAKELGGWHDWYDFGLGWDNTSIAYRALMAGYKILLDETNVAICIDHWPFLKGAKENGGMERARRLNDPIYLFETQMLKSKKLPLKRTQEIDDQIDCEYEVPKDISDDDMVRWVQANAENLVIQWLSKYNKGF